MKFAQNNHPTSLFGPICLFGTWEYIKSAYFMRNKSYENTSTQNFLPKFDLDMIMYVIGGYSRVSTLESRINKQVVY